MLRSYIEIQRSRYGNFQFVVELEDGTEDAAIPKMVLQPIIENSFSHGSIGEDMESSRCRSNGAAAEF